MADRLLYDSYLDCDRDLFVWVGHREGYRWYPRDNWDFSEAGVDRFVTHIGAKVLEDRLDLNRLRQLARIALLDEEAEDHGLRQNQVFVAARDLGHP